MSPLIWVPGVMPSGHDCPGTAIRTAVPLQTLSAKADPGVDVTKIDISVCSVFPSISVTLTSMLKSPE